MPQMDSAEKYLFLLANHRGNICTCHRGLNCKIVTVEDFVVEVSNSTVIFYPHKCNLNIRVLGSIPRNKSRLKKLVLSLQACPKFVGLLSFLNQDSLSRCLCKFQPPCFIFNSLGIKIRSLLRTLRTVRNVTRCL